MVIFVVVFVVVFMVVVVVAIVIILIIIIIIIIRQDYPFCTICNPEKKSRKNTLFLVFHGYEYDIGPEISNPHHPRMQEGRWGTTKRTDTQMDIGTHRLNQSRSQI